MDDISKGIETLKLGEGNIEGSLDKMLQGISHDESVSEALCSKGVLEVIAKQLEVTQEPKYLAKMAQLVAEMTKAESIRMPCVNAGLIPPLVNIMNHQVTEVVLQTSRALGNICFDNDEARAIIDQSGGLEKLMDLIKNRCLSNDANSENQKLRVVCFGHLLNLTNSNEGIHNKVFSLGAVAALEDFLTKYADDTSLCEMVLLCIDSLLETESGRMKFACSGIVEILVKLLEQQDDGEIHEAILDIFAVLAENDLIKVNLTKYHLVEILARLMNTHRGYQANFTHTSRRSSEAFSLEKAATDIIVLILTEDESMKLIFNHGEGELLKEVMSSWLQSQSIQRKISGALVIGNFARSDEHCIKLVECGVLTPLQELLQQHTNPGDIDMKLQHAILSSFRNLAIPAVNKPIMLQSGVLDTVLLIIQTEMAPVQFKLLATIRMLVDGQAASAAVQVGGSEALVKRITELCEVPDHAGVAGEANRLLAALVKNSGSSSVMTTVVKSGGLPYLVAMATSEYPIMQTEALVAIALIASTTLENTESDFKKSSLLRVLHQLLTSAETQPEVMVNVLTVTELLLNSADLKKEVKELDIASVVKTLTSQSNQMIKDKAKTVYPKIKS
ncbi:rap1 GTPase-GDP dissociation stimulator 1-B-like isoform X2 [Ptychodera flava]|uniref:rap1 GTPase-GDP dissociation stimulator 1-B-like isoform X2 n=1 Tax=Ptychodera flava TaxID=63121 RepID=UPI00396A9E7A